MADPEPSDDTLKGLVDGLVSGPLGLERLKEEARAKRRGMFTEWQNAGRRPDPAPEPPASRPLSETFASPPAEPAPPPPQPEPAPPGPDLSPLLDKLDGLQSALERARGETLDRLERAERGVSGLEDRLARAEGAAEEARSLAARLEGELAALRRELSARPSAAGVPEASALDTLSGEIQAVRRAWLESLRRSLARPR